MEVRSLLTLLSVTALLAFARSQGCSELQQSELDGMNGLIAELTLTGDNPDRPSVTVNDFQIVCLAAASTRDRYRFVSVVVDYVCSGNPNCIPSPAQFDFQCEGGSWIASLQGSIANVQGTPATGTLTTMLRTDCSFCLGASVAAANPFFFVDSATVDSETHCAPCDSLCIGPDNNGLDLCTGTQADSCCNVFVNDMCMEECSTGLEPLNGECVVSCGTLPDIDNGRVVLTTTFVNSIATYECDTGYNLSEDVTRTCVDNGGTGTWSMSEPTCIIVDCGNLTDPDNGNVNHPTTTFGSNATYSCDSGFELSGNVQRTCQANGTWDGSEPTCVADCGRLSNPTNGEVTFIPPNVTTAGSQATYSCNSGFTINGDENRFCQNDRTWSGTAPSCQPVDCGPLSIDDGVVSFSSGTTLNSTATYNCFRPFTISGNPERQCQASGEWSGSVPTCEVDSATGAGTTEPSGDDDDDDIEDVDIVFIVIGIGIFLLAIVIIAAALLYGYYIWKNDS